MKPTCYDVSKVLASIGSRPADDQVEAIAYLAAYLAQLDTEIITARILTEALISESRSHEQRRIYLNRIRVRNKLERGRFTALLAPQISAGTGVENGKPAQGPELPEESQPIRVVASGRNDPFMEEYGRQLAALPTHRQIAVMCSPNGSGEAAQLAAKTILALEAREEIEAS